MSLSRPLVADILLTNIIIMVKSTGVRGPTLARLAMVLVWQSCGKPSTKFPHGGLVECLYFPNLLYNSSLKLQNFENFQYFHENSHIFEIDRSSGTLWIWHWHCLLYILSHLSKYSIYSGQEILCVFSSIIMQNMVNSIKFSNVAPFFAGPCLSG